ncbi:MAG: heavy-metal-associated domain-containing protein [Euryarchaeota archaeon]|nr:heavy-metal-associated domain-containing protein [Euryarchaeota archaeon]
MQLMRNPWHKGNPSHNGGSCKRRVLGQNQRRIPLCPTPTCDTVYFNNSTGIYLCKSHIRTRIGIKESSPPRPLCYCNRVTQETLKHVILERRCCATLEEVQELTGAGKGKWCITTNPSGRCCEWYLKDIILRYLAQAGVQKSQHSVVVKAKKKLLLRISGMTCPGCAGVVKGNLEAAGAENVKVSFSEGMAEMLIPAELDESILIDAVEATGYRAEIISRG